MTTLDAEPAGAHETHLRYGNSSAAVGANHTGVRVCNRDPGYTAQIRFYTAADPGDEQIWGDTYDDYCSTWQMGSPITRWRLGLFRGGGCTGWKTA